MTELNFSFSRKTALAAVLLIPALALLLCLLGILMGLLVWSQALPVAGHERRLLLVLLPLFCLFFLHLAFSLLRGYETFFSVFRLDESGLVINNRRYGSLRLTWDEVTRASYSRLQKVISIRSPKLRRPVRIVSSSRERQPGQQLRSARELLRTQLGTRWSERWW